MGDTSVTKDNSQFSPQGAMGQKYLALGVPIAVHTYSILEPFTAIEATYPPAHVHGRDER